VASAVTAVTFALGLGCAWYLAKEVSGKKQMTLLFLLVLPFWTSSLARLYGWFFLLGASGPVSRGLAALGAIPEPKTLLFNGPVFFLGLVYNTLPYMVLPLYGVLSRLDDDCLQAAADLYARPRDLWIRVILPLSAPGWMAGAVIVWISALGDFITAEVLYGSKKVFTANLIQSQFLVARNWPLGSALTLTLLAAVALALGAGYVLTRRCLPHVFRKNELLLGFESGAAG
jgi:spermidine/putrescine transport system permease protein